MKQAWRDFYEAKRFLDRIWNSPFSGRRWPGYLSVEQIMVRLGLHRHSVYKLIHKHLVPRGGVYRRGWGRHGRAGRLLVTQESFEDYLKDRERRRRRNKLVTATRWTRSGPRPVPPKPAPPAREEQTPPPPRVSLGSVLFRLLPPEERLAIIRKVLAKSQRCAASPCRASQGQAAHGLPEAGTEARVPPTPSTL